MANSTLSGSVNNVKTSVKTDLGFKEGQEALLDDCIRQVIKAVIRQSLEQPTSRSD